MPRLTKQKAFDIVAKHLFEQGQPSIDTSGATCMYRAPGGFKCAIGVLIPDDEYRSEFETRSVRDILPLVPSIKHLNVGLLDALQIVHDFSDGWRSSENMKIELRDVARIYRVKADILNDLSFNRK